MISLESVSKKYNGKVLLDHVCQSFDAGGAVAFMGHNGCGKSTLLKIIAGLVKPTTGCVTSDRRVLFHYVPEMFMPVPLTARAYLGRMGIFAELVIYGSVLIIIRSVICHRNKF